MKNILLKFSIISCCLLAFIVHNVWSQGSAVGCADLSSNTITVDGTLSESSYTLITEAPFAAPIAGGSTTNSDFIGESSNNNVYDSTNNNAFGHGDCSTDIQNFYVTWDANNLYLAIEGPCAFQASLFDQMDLFVAIDTDNNTGTGITLDNTQAPFAKNVDFAGWAPDYFVAVERVEFSNDYAALLQTGGTTLGDDINFNSAGSATGFEVGFSGNITEVAIPWSLFGGQPSPLTGAIWNFAVYTTYDGDGYDAHDSAPGIGNLTDYEEIGDLPFDADHCDTSVGGAGNTDPVSGAFDNGCTNCETDQGLGAGDDDDGFGNSCGNKSPASDNTDGDIDTIEEYFQIVNVGQECMPAVLEVCNCDGSADTLIAMSEPNTFNTGKTQVYILTDATGIIIEINPTGVFLNVPTGSYNIYALNYDPTDTSVTQVTDNIEVGDNLLANFNVGTSTSPCYDLIEADASVNQCNTDSEVNLTASTCDPLNVGVDTVTLISNAGCDSLIITTTILIEGSETNLSATTCDPLNAGVDTVTLMNTAGCDSLVITTTTLLPSDETNLSATTCDPLNVGVDTVTLTNSVGCDSLVITTTTLLAGSETNLSATTCDMVNVGVDTVILMNTAGCDSLVITTTTLVDGNETSLSATTCDPLNVGTDTVALMNTAGCDSLVITTTTLVEGSETNLSETTCNPFNVGVDTITLVNTVGCDSLVITTTTLAANDTTNVFATTCDPNLVGETMEILQGQLCDSVVITTTTLLPSSETNLSATTCDPSNVGVDTVTLMNTAGCDSLVITTTTLVEGSETNLSATTCDPSNVGVDTVTLMNTAGCDSLVITTTTLVEGSETNLSATTCDMANVGVDTVTLMNTAGCDSLVITTTTLIPSDITTLPTTVTCNINEVGVDTMVLTNSVGCDSLVISTVELDDCESPTVLEVCNCDGSVGTLIAVSEPGSFDENKTQVYILVDESGVIIAISFDGTFTNVSTGIYEIYALNYDTNDANVNQVTDNIEVGDNLLENLSVGNNQSPCYDLTGPANATVNQCGQDSETNLSAITCDPLNTGVDTMNLVSSTGCDSLVITTTTLIPTSETNLSATTCEMTNVGVDTVVLTSSAGCDSLVITTTTLLDESETNLSETSCNPANVGIDTVVLVNSVGCDSLVITTTTLAANDTINVFATTCDSNLVGEMVEVLQGQLCDSVVITTTTLLPGSETNLSATTCDPLNVGVDTVTLMNTVGCDSLVITTTTLVDESETNLSATTCDPLNVGVDTITLMNTAGCDSLVITTTTLVDGSETTLSATTCDPLNVGVDTVTLMNTAGCDSLVITTTTLVDGSETTLSATTCDPLNVGVDTVTLMNIVGCDSLVITTTTLLDGSETTLSATTCDPLNVGVDTATLINTAGCDSLVITTTTLLSSDVTMLPTTFTCDETLAGIDTMFLTNSAGCDSLVISTIELEDCSAITFCLCNGDDPNLNIMSEPGTYSETSNTQVYILTSSFGTILENNTTGAFDLSIYTDGTYNVYALNFSNADSSSVVPAYEVGEGIDAFINNTVTGCYDLQGPQSIVINPASCDCVVDCSNVVPPIVEDIIACEGDPTILILGSTGEWIINETLSDPPFGMEGDANGDGMRDDDGFNSEDEFVEIINNTGMDVDISGWTLSDAVTVRHTFPNGTVVPDGGTIVIFGGGDPTGLFGGAIVQTASTGFIGLNTGGDQVILSDNAGNVLTQVAFGDEGDQDQSLVRDPDLFGNFVAHSTATTANGAFFSPGTQSDGTPFSSTGATYNFFANYPPGAGDTLAYQVGFYDPAPAVGTTETIYITTVQGTCESEPTSVNVTVETAPFAEVIMLDSLCNLEGGDKPTSVDLINLVLNGATDGTWTNEVGDTLTSFTSQDLLFGDYQLTYTVNPSEGSTCEAVSYETTIRVINCGDVCDAFVGPTSQEIVICGEGSTELTPTGAGLIGQFAPEAFFSELHYDNVSIDTLEGFEITGTAGFDLTGYIVYAYNGNGGTIYNDIALSGTISNSGNGYGALYFEIIGLQNGPDAIALVDADGNVIDFISYEGEVTATEGPANGLTSTEIGVTESNSTPDGLSLQLGDNGWYGPVENTYNAINDNLTIGAQNEALAYNFYGDADLTNLLGSGASYDPMTEAGTTDSIWITATDGTCTSQAVASIVTVQAAPSATVIDTTYLCNIEGGPHPTSINLNDLITDGPFNGATNFWSLNGTFLFNTNVDATSLDSTVVTYVYNILPSSAATECDAVALEAVIILEDCDTPDPCEGFETPSVADVTYCEGEDNTIIPSGGGLGNPVTYNFYDNDPTQGGTLLTNGSSYAPSTDGTYWITATADDCESEAASVVVEQQTATPTANLNDITVCNDPLEGSTSVNLTDLIAQGSTEGTFTNTDGNIVTSFDANGLEVGIYTFTYTISGSCGNNTYSTDITVADCLQPGECPELDAPVVISFYICEGDNFPTLTPVLSYLINEEYTFYYYDADPASGNATLLGTGNSFTNPGLSELWVTVVREDGCQSSAAVSYLNINTPPTAAILNNATVCDNADEGNTSIDLFSLISEGTTNGTFTDADGNMITTFDGNGVALGDYTFTYTLNGPTGCGSASSEVTVSVEDCLVVDPCEGFAAPTVDGTISECPDYIVTITPTGGGFDGNVTYNFYDDDPTQGGTLLSTGTTYETTIGEYWITAIGGENCESSAVAIAFAITDPEPLPASVDNATVCDNADEGNTSIDLISLVTVGQTDGVFTDVDGNIITSFDGNGIALGIYSLTYTITVECEDLSTDFTITVEDCFIPDPCEGFTAPEVEDITVCEGESTEIIPSGGGFNDGNATYNFYDGDPANGGTLITSGISYDPATSTTVWITAIGGDNCESSPITVTISISTATPTATLIESTSICQGTEPFSLTDLIEEGSTEGVFTNENDVVISSIDPSDIPAGTYELTYSITGDGTCTANVYTTTVIILPATPTALVEDGSICNDPTEGPSIVFLPNLIVDGSTDGVFNDADGNEINSLDASTLEMGTYNFTYIITGECGDNVYSFTVDVIDCFVPPTCPSIATVGETEIDVCSNESVNLEVSVTDTDASNITWSTGETGTTSITISDLVNESCDPVMQTITASIPSGDENCEEITSVSFNINVLPDPSTNVNITSDGCNVVAIACPDATVSYSVDGADFVEGNSYGVNPEPGTTIIQQVDFLITSTCGEYLLISEVENINCETPSVLSIGNFVWNDENENGIQDAEEAGVEGVTVTLYDEDGNIVETTTTDPDGFYGFFDISEGNYYIGITLPDGFVFTMQDMGGNEAADSDVNADGFTDIFTIGAGITDLSFDAGIYLEEVITEPCADFQALASVICDNEAGTYQIVLTYQGGDAGDNGYLITDNNTGVSYTTTATNQIYGPFENNTGGYNYTVSVVNHPECIKVLSQSLVDCVVTSVELLNFDGKALEEGNYLHWTTASERENDFFTLMRSKDGENFEPINTQDGAGTSNTVLDYNFLDQDAPKGFSYYRLEQTDFDGQVTRSNIVTLWRGEASNNTMAIAPIPANDHINVSYVTTTQNEVNIQVYDAIGRLVKTETLEVIEGLNQVQLDISSYTSGVYFLSIQNGEDIVTDKFIKE